MNDNVTHTLEMTMAFEPLIPNATTIAAMKEAQQGNLPRFANVKGLMDDLNADD